MEVSGRGTTLVLGEHTPSATGKSSLANREASGGGGGDGLGPRWRLWRRRRFVLAALGFLGFMSLYVTRISFSVAIVAMTRGSGAHERFSRTTAANASSDVLAVPEGEFSWDESTRGLLLAGFFYGYAASQLPAGWVAARAGAAALMGAGVAGSAALALMAPLAAEIGGSWLLLAVRVAQGLLQGAVFPSMKQVSARWAPPLERSTLVSTMTSGCNVGVVLSMSVSGLLAAHLGWSSIFYVTGALGCLWWILWWLQVVDSPQIDSRITATEKDFIQRKTGDTIACSKVVSHPWRKIFTSPPGLAATAAGFCVDWVYYTLVTEIPAYLEDTLGYDLKSAGFVSALPFVVAGVARAAAGYLADWLERRRLLSSTHVRKAFVCGGFAMVILCLLLSTALADAPSVVTCIAFGVGFISFVYAGLGVNGLDLAPLHAGVLSGAANTVANMSGFLSPHLTGFIVQTQSAAEWRLVFYIASGLSLLGAACFGLFGSGERQPWADDGLQPPEDPKSEGLKAEYPKAEYPKAECPKAEEPKVQDPKAEYPKAEYPKTEYPKAEYPKAEYPKAEYLKVEYPKTENP